MFEAVWMNFASFIFGLGAWILPAVNLVQRNKSRQKNRVIYSAASFCACAVSVCMQIFYMDQLVKAEDWPALTDISGAVSVVAIILVAVTVILNVTAYGINFRKT